MLHIATLTLRNSRLRRQDDGSYTREHDPEKRYRVELSVDLDAIAHRLGSKAAQSKGKKSRALNGALVAKIKEI